MTLSEIIARLEAATGPDRELDAEIAVYLGWQRPDAKRPYAWTRPIGPDGSVTTCNDSFIPRYTASVDAAATLLLPGWRVEKLSFGKHVNAERDYCHCTLERDCYTADRDLDDDEATEIEALNLTTAPLALCAAALRARSAQ